MDADKLVTSKLEASLSGESEHPLNLLNAQLKWTAQEMERSAGAAGHPSKLDHLLTSFREHPDRDGSVLGGLNNYWLWFQYYAPGSQYDDKGSGAINRFGGFVNEGYRTAVTEQAQICLAKITAVMSDIVSMSLWLADDGSREDYIQPALERVAEASLDYYHHTSPDMTYYGRLGQDEDFRDTDMGVRIVPMHDTIKSLPKTKAGVALGEVDASEVAGLTLFATEAAVHSLCAQLTYAKKTAQVYKLTHGLDQPNQEAVKRATQLLSWEN